MPASLPLCAWHTQVLRPCSQACSAPPPHGPPLLGSLRLPDPGSPHQATGARQGYTPSGSRRDRGDRHRHLEGTEGKAGLRG